MADIYHLIGIGGAGMSAVAQLLAERGFKVSGSDQTDSAVLERLRGQGIEATGHHDSKNVSSDAIVVVSSAIGQDNPELQIARSRHQKVIHRSEALAMAADGRRFIAVAGAHGKTTTSGMLAHILDVCGADPSFAVGSGIIGLGTGARIGMGGAFVAEADESDESFLNYSPRTAIVTNVEPDHLDHYDSEEAFREVFFRFAKRIEPGGTLICCADDPGSAALAQRVREEIPSIRVVTYGTVGDVRLSRIHHADGISRLGERGSVSWNGAEYIIELQVAGWHNLENATAAWIAAVCEGIDLSKAAAALGSFRGTGRRFELRGEVNGRRLFDDYAHHPTEVAAMVAQARQVAGDGQVVVLFQPHLYSRTLVFADRFAKALSDADQVFLADIYGAREEPMPGVSAALISRGVPGAVYVPGQSVEDVAGMAAASTPEGAILVLTGAGDITRGGEAALLQWSGA